MTAKKVIVTCGAVATAKLLCGVCDCPVDGEGLASDNSLALGLLHICGKAHEQSHVPLGMD